MGMVVFKSVRFEAVLEGGEGGRGGEVMQSNPGFKFDGSARESPRVHESFRPNESI